MNPTTDAPAAEMLGTITIGTDAAPLFFTRGRQAMMLVAGAPWFAEDGVAAAFGRGAVRRLVSRRDAEARGWRVVPFVVGTVSRPFLSVAGRTGRRS